MTAEPFVTKVEVVEFEYTVKDWGQVTKVPTLTYKPGNTHHARAMGLRVHTDQGIIGDYVGGNAVEYAAIPAFVGVVLEERALAREVIYNRAKLALRQHARMGMGVLDIALWDLAGKYYDTPIYVLLGGERKKLPCYVSTALGDDEPDGLSTPEAYADFAEECLEMGYNAFKIHGWVNAPIEKQIALVHAVGKRVGGKMDLMLDPFCAIETFGDALKLGWACDEYSFFWWEDPFMDGGVSAFAHKKLRQLVRTPLLQLEHLRGLEPHVDFIVAEGTDFVRGDAHYDGGITGVMKLCHAAEGFGLDVELHIGTAPHQQIMAAVRNMNYLEYGLFHPRVAPPRPPIYKKDYTHAIDAPDENGCVEPPEGPGLGVGYDWDYIYEHKTDGAVYELK